jgi:hypothetical protein
VLQGSAQSNQPLSGGTTAYPPQQSVPPWNPAPARPRYAYTTIQYPVGTRLATQNICITWNAPTTINGASVKFDLTPSGTVQFFAKASGLLYTNAIRLTQLIDVYGQAHSFNATLTFTENPCPP